MRRFDTATLSRVLTGARRVPAMSPRERIRTVPEFGPEMTPRNAGSISFRLYQLREKFGPDREPVYPEGTRDIVVNVADLIDERTGRDAATPEGTREFLEPNGEDATSRTCPTRQYPTA